MEQTQTAAKRRLLYTAKTHTVGGEFSLEARLNIGLPGLDREAARSLVDSASQLCPYSLAVKGNIKVEYNLI